MMPKNDVTTFCLEYTHMVGRRYVFRPFERDDCIKKDDEVFEHIIQSFQYRKEDGTYAKPENVRQPDEVKEDKSKGNEYYGNKQQIKL